MKFISFASSSDGNAAYISYKNTDALVDCGIGIKKLVECLGKIDKTVQDIKYVFITHEHIDHIKSIVPLFKMNPNIIITGLSSTMITIAKKFLENSIVLRDRNFHSIYSDNPSDANKSSIFGDIIVYKYSGFHDVPSVYYKFIMGKEKVAIITDMGKYNDNVIETISDVDYLMLECNYDKEMLLNNPKYYPPLKNRIMGPNGHLSNVDTSEIIMKLAGKNVKRVYLSHISPNNNTEEYALSFVNDYIKNHYSGDKVLPEILVAKQKEMTYICE